MPPLNKETFIKLFKQIAPHKNRYLVFSDFVTTYAIAIHNSVNKVETLEAEYMNIIGGYTKNEISSFCQMCACLVEMLQPEPHDILGEIFMELDFAETQRGQFYTPACVSDFMAQLQFGKEMEDLKQTFVTLSDPACGAGSMILAFTKAMIANRQPPHEKLWVQCIDVDRLSAMMCYLQLALWNIPAQVIVGNSLTLEFREQYFTPAHYLWRWDTKLRLRKMFEVFKKFDKSFEVATTDAVITPSETEPVIFVNQTDLFE